MNRIVLQIVCVLLLCVMAVAYNVRREREAARQRAVVAAEEKAQAEQVREMVRRQREERLRVRIIGGMSAEEAMRKILADEELWKKWER